MKANKDAKVEYSRIGRAIAWGSAALLLALCCVLIGLYFVQGGETTTVDLQNYVNIGWDANGAPAAMLDVDALLTDLHLPNPKYSSVNQADYPDVDALCRMKLYLSYTDSEDVMVVTIVADTETLHRYGILFDELTWEQTIKGFVAGTQPTPTPPVPTAEPDVSPTPRESMTEGFLSALLDNDGNGLNLRAVCERVQAERDYLCKEILGNSFDTDKTQVAFIVGEGGDPYYNLYRCSYTAETKEEGDAEPTVLYFTVDVFDLYWTGDAVTFDRVDVSICRSETESKRLPDRQSVTKLYGGGVRVAGKSVFDQNGFVKFPNHPTSYKMGSGIFWSPTYDALTEDMIWSLTATDTRSLANVLRYARKEIYARYYMAFDPKSEREFYDHYRSYAWYEEKDPDWESRMTETEWQNIRLLREIQSLIEN